MSGAMQVHVPDRTDALEFPDSPGTGCGSERDRFDPYASEGGASVSSLDDAWFSSQSSARFAAHFSPRASHTGRGERNRGRDCSETGERDRKRSIDRTSNEPTRQRRGSKASEESQRKGSKASEERTQTKNIASDGSIPNAARGYAVKDDGSFGQSWMVRLQADKDTRATKQEVSRSILNRVEATLPEVATMDATSRVRLTERVGMEIDRLLVAMSRKAYETVKEELESAQAIKIDSAEYESKLSQMSASYLKEVTQIRDRNRPNCDELLLTVEAKPEEAYVNYYEPMRFLSSEHRQHVLSVVEERLKQIFAVDPGARDRCDKASLAQFEEQVLKEKAEYLAKANANLRDEVNDYRGKLKKAEENIEKTSFEMADLTRRCSRFDQDIRAERDAHRAELQASEARAEVAEKQCQVLQVRIDSQSISTEQALKRAQELESEGDALRREVIQMRDVKRSLEADMANARVQMRVLMTQKEGGQDVVCSSELVDAESQVGDDLPGRQEANAPTRRDDIEQNKELKAQVEKLSAERDAAWKALTERDAAQKALKEKQAQAAQAAQAAGMASQDKVERIKAELEQVKEEADLSKESNCVLRQEVKKAKSLAAAAEQRRLDFMNQKMGSGKGSASDALVAELRQQTLANKDLTEELNQIKSAFSLQLSRFGVLELQLAALQPEKVSLGKISQEHSQLAILSDQRAQLRDKVTIHKAQLDEVVRDNQVMTLALREMQQEVQELTRQLRKAMPESSAIPKDLQTIMENMETVVKDGGGGYIRMYKEAKLREVAKNALKKKQGEDSEDETASQATSHDGSPGPIQNSSIQIPESRFGRRVTSEDSRTLVVSEPTGFTRRVTEPAVGLCVPNFEVFPPAVSPNGTNQRAQVGSVSQSPRPVGHRPVGQLASLTPPQSTRNRRPSREDPGPLIGQDLDTALLTAPPPKVRPRQASPSVETTKSVAQPPQHQLHVSNLGTTLGSNFGSNLGGSGLGQSSATRLLVVKQGSHTKPLPPVIRK